MTTARSTPGWPNAGCGTLGSSTARPARKATNETVSPTASVTAPNTAAFAASTRGRFGIAASVDRIIPEEYSPVITSTPSTPIRSWPSASPASTLLVGSKDALSWVLTGGRVLAITRMPMAIMLATVAARIQVVERRLRSLIHSIRVTCESR